MDATPLPAISSNSQEIIVNAENNIISVFYSGHTGGGGGNGYWQIDNRHSYLADKYEVENLKKELESLKAVVARLANNKIDGNKSLEESSRRLETGN